MSTNTSPMAQVRVACDVFRCSKTFRSSYEMKRHMEEQHEDPKRCPWCPREERRFSRLWEHMEESHPKSQRPAKKKTQQKKLGLAKEADIKPTKAASVNPRLDFEHFETDNVRDATSLRLSSTSQASPDLSTVSGAAANQIDLSSCLAPSNEQYTGSGHGSAQDMAVYIQDHYDVTMADAGTWQRLGVGGANDSTFIYQQDAQELVAVSIWDKYCP
ncbi:uncharacterized protein LY89DRAFT_742031 [Mollisia scopiformis]|uniref:C2H2-type domain-containing protein n=1 Tax=Mollisia scopiformis TaxID=149040 RepID=A0A132B947_MOLSC|nr:uncharacterized protein LY89DRAFT_742031 [Mollisia scopiformis]KUJ08187.1 hypothetical protein LY89DRAFT_742031 [Mollisia scopiformis]